MRIAGVFALESRGNLKSHFRRKSFIRNGLRQISRSFVQGITGAVRHARRGAPWPDGGQRWAECGDEGGLGGEDSRSVVTVPTGIIVQRGVERVAFGGRPEP